jgi:hypothetical protein
MGDELERKSKDDVEALSMDEIEAEGAVPLPNKEVMSLLDVNANVDLGLDLAAPVDLAAAANLNVAAPIEASAAANVLSADAQAVSVAQQHGTIDQLISGSANATADQHADIAQNSNPEVGGTAPDAGGTTPDAAGTTPDASGTTPDAGGTVPAGTTPDVGAATPAAGGTTPDAGGVVDGAVGALPDAPAAPGDVTDPAAGAVDSLLQGGSLLDANVDIHANANLTAPIDGAVAANANVAAPIDASVAANIGSDNAVAQALADQQVDIHQSLDGVEANADATQDSSIDQQ